MMLACSALIFDFDYTLADSSRGVESCINYALQELGFPPVPYETVCQTIGFSLEETYARLTGNPAAQGNEFRRLFIERAEDVMVEGTFILGGIPEAIETLRKDFTLGIVSTKFRRRIEAILNREGMRDPFAVIVGAEDVIRHKPDPESLLLALEKLDVSPEEAVYIGDSIVDATAAQSAGVRFIAVLSGVTERNAFQGFDVLQFLESAKDLPGWVRDTSG
jgi:phosphoglycolate phosphatase